MSWFHLHPKVKALALAVIVLVIASIPASLNGTVTWHDTGVADVTAAVALAIAYLKGVSPDA